MTLKPTAIIGAPRCPGPPVSRTPMARSASAHAGRRWAGARSAAALASGPAGVRSHRHFWVINRRIGTPNMLANLLQNVYEVDARRSDAAARSSPERAASTVPGSINSTGCCSADASSALSWVSSSHGQ